MAERKRPIWLRLVQIVAGIIVLLLAAYVIFNPSLAINLLRILLGIALIVLGLALIVRSVAVKATSMGGKIVEVILGIIILALGVAAIVYTNFGTAALITLFAVGLLLNAIGSIAYSGYEVGVGLPPWLRGTSLVLGVIALIIAIAVIVFPGLALALLTLLVALALFLLGLELIVSGAAG